MQRKGLIQMFGGNKIVLSEYPDWYKLEQKKYKSAHVCMWCGNRCTNSRKTTCSDECRREVFFNFPQYQTNVRGLRREIHKQFDFKCVKCLTHFVKTAPSGMHYPTFAGEVDHIKALINGGEDSMSNLQLLCSKCHKEKTKEDLYGRK